MMLIQISQHLVTKRISQHLHKPDSHHTPYVSKKGTDAKNWYFKTCSLSGKNWHCSVLDMMLAMDIATLQSWITSVCIS